MCMFHEACVLQDLVIMLEQYAHDPLHALSLHRFACEMQQVLQSVCGTGGFAQVKVKSGRFTGFGQSKLFHWNLLKSHLLQKR